MYLMSKLNEYAVQGKLRSKHALELCRSAHLADRPPLASRAAEWRRKYAIFGVALAGASPGDDICKLIPFKERAALHVRARRSLLL